MTITVALVMALSGLGAGPRDGQAVSDPATRALIEADWAAELEPAAPTVPVPPAIPVTTREDAAGGNDGVINGSYGFHCASGAPDSWWQVDLGKPWALDRVVVYNRCGGSEMRAAKALVVLVSNDGKSWDLAHQHDGSFFGGYPDKKPLVIRFDKKPVTARFVRLQERAAVSFHLDEIEVYPRDDPQRNIALGRPSDQSSVGAWSTRTPRGVGSAGFSPSLPPSPPAGRGGSGAGVPPAIPEAGKMPAPPPLNPPVDGGKKIRPEGRTTNATPEPPARGGITPKQVEKVIEDGHRLLERLARLGAGDRLRGPAERLRAAETRLAELKASGKATPADWRALWLDAHWAVRESALANPLLDFDRLVFVKRQPGVFAHMCDQFYGCLARPGGGLFALENLGGDLKTRDLLAGRLPSGSVLSADLSFDGRQIVFAHTRNPGSPKARWEWTPELSYHLYLMNADGTGLRQLTDGPDDDIHPRFLPDGGIAFISTRRGGYCRCGARPVPTYTLHRVEPDGSGLTRLSHHETNEWTPAVTNDGRLVYTRWDYVDRHTNLAHSLWTSLPDGSNPAVLFGNYNFLKKPWGLWYPEAVPGSGKFVAIAGAHHGYAEGSLVLIDPRRGQDGLEPLERLTPDVPFPEAEGWPTRNYASATPLSEDFYLVAYSPAWSARSNLFRIPLGLYLLDRWGHRELLYRDPAIASMCPIPLRPRPLPHVLPIAEVTEEGGRRSVRLFVPTPERRDEHEGERRDEQDGGAPTGRLLLLNVYQSTEPFPRVPIRNLRIIQILPKTTIVADAPRVSAARQVSARYLLGTVPVEADGSAFFTVPAGVPLYFQAVGEDGMAVQSMRSITYVQPGETLTCSGCHEHRASAPPNAVPLAAQRPPSAIAPGPDGSMPFSYPRLLQPVLDRHCVRCHTGADAKGGVRLTGVFTPKSGQHSESYQALATRKLVHRFDSVNGGEWVPRTYPGQFGARASRLIEILRKGHYDAKLNAEEFGRFSLWIDLNIPFYGVYEPAQVAEQRRGGTVPLAAIVK